MSKKGLRYIGFFRDVLENAANVQGPYGHLTWNTIAYLVMDTLSKCMFPEEGHNAPRFQSFIRDFAAWEDGNRVSLPHIARLVEIIPSAFTEEFRKIIREKMSKWNGAFQSIESDPWYNELEKSWPQTLPDPYRRFKLSMFQHRSILYSFRNDLLHELKMHGEGHMPGYCKPYYYLSHIASSFESQVFWRLYYPPLFIRTLSETCLSNVEKHLRDNGKDPYESHDYGIFIFPEFNKYGIEENKKSAREEEEK